MAEEVPSVEEPAVAEDISVSEPMVEVEELFTAPVEAEVVVEEAVPVVEAEVEVVPEPEPVVVEAPKPKKSKATPTPAPTEARVANPARVRVPSTGGGIIAARSTRRP